MSERGPLTRWGGALRRLESWVIKKVWVGAENCEWKGSYQWWANPNCDSI